MQHQLRLGHVLASLFFLLSFTTAWPWPLAMEKLDGLIIRRQANSPSSSGSSSSSATNTGSSSSPASNTDSSQTTNKPSGTSKSGSSSSSGSGTKSGSPSPTATGTSGSSKSSKGAAAATSAVDPRLPAGGVNLLEPSQVQIATYYKIGQSIEFKWNYTSLSVQPSYIDILVTCTANSATYTLSSNASFASTGSVTWDTKPDITGTAPLLTETYTLVIHDASKDMAAIPQAGHLGTYNQYHLNMYLPQAYTPLSDWTCATCSGALSDMERQTLKFMLGMCMVTILSFTWFVGGFGGLI